ncbi:MAG: S1C family serine protease [Phycisphaerae bacterium]
MSRITGATLPARQLSAFFILHSAFLAAALAQPADVSASELRSVVQDAIRIASPAIVRIDTVGGAQPVASEGQPPTAGFRQADGPTTGVIWTSDGWIVTSSFNFLRDPSIITVTLHDGRRLVAKLVARDHPNRLALLKVDATDLPIPQFAASSELRVGQRVLVAGFGFSSSAPAVSLGVLSARDRMNGVALQTDAKTSPANYGGPLFDLDGRVLGIVVPLGASEDEAAGVDWYDSGIGFAISNEQVNRRLPRLQKGESLERGLMGIFLETRDPVEGIDTPASTPEDKPKLTIPTDGCLVTLDPLGPALDAGMRYGDVLLSVDGEPTTRLIHFRRAIAKHAAGDTVNVSWRRDRETFAAEIKLVTRASLRPPASQPASGPADSQPTSEPADVAPR